MAIDYQDTFQRIVAKANVLAERYRALAQSKEVADARIAELQAQVASQAKELEMLRQEAEYLRMAAVLAPTRDEIEGTRAIISSLVRDIDRCITDLSD